MLFEVGYPQDALQRALISVRSISEVDFLFWIKYERLKRQYPFPLCLDHLTVIVNLYMFHYNSSTRVRLLMSICTVSSYILTN